MSSFTKPIQTEWSEDHPRLAKTLETYVYYLEWREDSDFVRVDEGFLFDGASTPGRYDWILPRWNGKTIKAALFHDALYKYRTVHTANGHTYKIDRKFADKLFYEMLLLGGASYIKRSKSMKKYRMFTWKARAMVAYMVLRTLGWLAWYRHRLNERRGKA